MKGEFTELHIAATEGDINKARALIDSKMDVNCVDEDLRTPLHYACEIHTTQLLIDAKADVNALDSNLETPLHTLMNEPYEIDVLKTLVKAGADLQARDIVGETPLHSAAKIGDHEVLEFFIQNGANVNALNAEGKTALEIACSEIHPNKPIMMSLISSGADFSNIKIYGKPLIDWSLCHEGTQLTQCLLDNRATIGPTTLHDAVKMNNAKVVESLLKSKADPKSYDKYGDTPLHIAARYTNSFDCAMLLILEDPDALTAANAKCKTALEVAGRNKNIEFVNFLYKIQVVITEMDMDRKRSPDTDDNPSKRQRSAF